MRVKLVGEANLYGSDPHFALYPSPEGSSGHRLCVAILGMRRKDYLEAFDRCNLLGQVRSWDAFMAMFAACRVTGDRLVLLGSKVTKAFGLLYDPFRTHCFGDGRRALVLPHPSGLCRAWNSPDSVLRAREKVAELAPEVAHLIGVVT